MAGRGRKKEKIIPISELDNANSPAICPADIESAERSK